MALHLSSLARRRLPPGRWPPDEGSPGRRSRLSVTLTGRRPPSARPAPPSARPAPPPSARPPPTLETGRAQPAGAGGGAPGQPRHGISSAKNESADFGGLKIDPQKSTRLQFLHQKVRRLFLGRYWKNHSDRTNTSKDIHKKHEGRAESAPPPFQCAC